MKYESTEQKIFKIAYPPVLYYFISMAAQLVISILVILINAGNTSALEMDINKSAEYFDRINEAILSYSVFMNALAAFVGIIIFCLIYIRDNREDGRPNLYNEILGMKGFDICRCYALGITAGMGINMFISLLPIDNIIGSYEETSKLLMNGAFYIIFPVLGIMVPIAEEILYRGVVYGRIKKYLGVNKAIVLSAVMFGLFHFNLKQGIFAFSLGLILAYVKEKFDSISASIAVHMAINQLTVIMSVIGLNTFLSRHIIVYLGLMLILIGIGIFILYQLIKRDNIA